MHEMNIVIMKNWRCIRVCQNTLLSATSKVTGMGDTDIGVTDMRVTASVDDYTNVEKWRLKPTRRAYILRHDARIYSDMNTR